MQYKTIMLEMLQDRPELHSHLRKNRKLMPALDIFARQLKIIHEGWKEVLSQMRPGSEPSQLASEALEIAIKEMEDHLQHASPNSEEIAPSLDQAMAFIQHHTSRG